MGRSVNLALDMGSSTLKGILFEIVEFQNDIHVLASKKEKTSGIEDGKIKNTDLLKEGIHNLISDLVNEVGSEIDEVFLAIPPVNTFTNLMVKNKIVADSSGASPISPSQVNDLTERILEEINKTYSQSGNTLIDFIINEYNVFTSPKAEAMIVENPIGMTAYSFSIDLYFVLAETYFISTIERIFEEFDILVDKVTVPFVPGALTAVPHTARKKGALYIDLGASFTNYVLFSHNSIVYSSYIPFGGNDITNDIVKAFRKSPDDRTIEQGEIKKKRYGSLKIEAEDSRKNIYLDKDLLSDNFLTLEQLKVVMIERVREIFEMINSDLKAGKSISARGINISQVILAGGTAQFEGIENIAEDIFKVPASVATPFEETPRDFGNIDSPEWISVYGLAQYFAFDERKPRLRTGFIDKIFKSLKTILKRKN